MDKPDLTELAEIDIKSLEDISVRDALLEMSDKIKKVWEWFDYSGWENGDILTGLGTLPLGAIIPIHDVGSNVSIPASGTINSDGFQFCDGVALGSGHGLGTGITNIPDLTENRFLMGTTLAGTAGATGGEDSVKLVTDNLPLHTHANTLGFTIPNHSHTVTGGVTNKAAFNTGNQSANHYHSKAQTVNIQNYDGTTNWIITNSTGGTNYRWGWSNNGYNRSTAIHVDVSGNTGYISHNHSHSVPIHGHSHTIAISSSGGGGACTKSGSVGNNTSAESSFSIVPKYMAVKYVMRVK